MQKVGKRIYSHTARPRECEFESHQGNELNPNQMNKFERLTQDLASAGSGKMKAFGNSMLPILKSGNAWTRTIYGKVVLAEYQGRVILER